MKKLLVLLLAVLFAFSLVACGNRSIGFGSFHYERIHIDTHHYSGCLTVEAWYESESGIEVRTSEAGSMFASEGTYVLLSGDKPCPFCAGKECKNE